MAAADTRSQPRSAPAPGTRMLALFPGGLGDFLCCWPALDRMRRAQNGQLTLAARPAWLELLSDAAATGISIDRREVADLFSHAPLSDTTRRLFGGFARVDSFTGHGDPNFTARLSDACGGARLAIHPFRAFRSGEHAAHYYARCLRTPPEPYRLPIRTAAQEWAAALWRDRGLGTRTLVIHPGSGSVRKNWQGMDDAARAWRAAGGSIVAVTGPAEATRTATTCDVALQNESLDRIAAVLARASHYLGNDSGISHLAGLVGARGVALFGPTDAAVWHPVGEGIRVVSRPDPCRLCGADAFCTHRLPVDDVIATLRSAPPHT